LATPRPRGSLPVRTTSSNPYRGFRFPAEVIEHAVWLYHCFSLSLRDVETILAARGVVVSYESIRDWGLRFGRQFANRLKQRRPRPGDKWFLDEVFIRIRIRSKLHYLWRAIDQDGHVLDILVQSRRNTRAAKRFFCKLLKGPAAITVANNLTTPRAIITGYAVTPDRLEIASYQRLSEQYSSGTGKLIALAAKSTVTNSVISATEKC
jgi:transposase-like protein